MTDSASVLAAHSLPPAGRWAAALMKHRGILWLSLFYLATRAVAFALFAPHTDEMNVALYVQLMRADWAHNQFMSLDGRMYGDYKEPITFWIASGLAGFFRSPVTLLRLLSTLMGWLGFLCTVKLARAVAGPSAAIFAGLWITLSDHFFYFDVIGIMEPWLQGLGAAALYFSFRYAQRGRARDGILGVLLFAALTLVKLSGRVWILHMLLAAPLALALEGRGLSAMAALLTARWRRWLLFYPPALFLGWLAPRLLYHPYHVRQGGALSYVREVHSLGEILGLPLASWLANLKYYESLISADLPWLWPLAALAGLLAMVLHRERRWTLACCWLIWIASFLPQVILLKAHFARHFGMGLHAWILFASVGAAAWSDRAPRQLRVVLAAVLALFIVGHKVQATWIPLARWGQSDYALIETQPEWPSGLGVKELLAELSSLPPGRLICGGEWGHIGTTPGVYCAWYPQLDVLPMGQDFLSHATEIVATLRREAGHIYLLLDEHTLASNKFTCLIYGLPLERRLRIERRYRGRTSAGYALLLFEVAPAGTR